MTLPLAVTMGDPAGVGPEIIVKACRQLSDRLAAGDLRLLVIGSIAALREAEAAFGGGTPIPEVKADAPAWPALACLRAGAEGTPVRPGTLSPEGGRFAYLAVKRAVDLALKGRVGGVVTAPLNKEALNLAGYPYSGHTEMLAELTGTRGTVMLLLHQGMRVSHLTPHVPLSQVSERLPPERLTRVIELTDAALADLGLPRRKIAVAALNPHAGEGGLFGREDLDVTVPTVAAARSRGFDVEGPVPGDTVFVKLLGGRYDAAVAMYHDQGHIPVKLLGFHVDPAGGAWTALSGVNVTLGLPIVRTSVDHGTAFDIAGRGLANEQSLIEAIVCAEKLAAARASSRDFKNGTSI